ncbi:hypothetical protein HFP51_04205 [Parasphingopyxis sp. CP4]|uniref:hypothetical protein n=1 Tax=Parasphingopyxis sp. CP4 TaxID=2724527 RepID=UPI0015A1D759|nr:hypothetical protein [Parasphingopyxis sp. CP4]QLC21455.1 hypothetical protein HFP51_04205 [Parasphingopyxis sp. CP4]
MKKIAAQGRYQRMRTVRLSVIGVSLAASAALAACSDNLTAEEEIAQIEAGRAATAEAEAREAAEALAAAGPMTYDRAVECAATAMNVSNVFDIIAQTDADSDPDRAADARQSAETNIQQAREFVRLAESLGSEPGKGRDNEAVMADVGRMDSQIRQRGRDAEDFFEFARQIAQESDQCDREFAVNE